jgi:hypothetical protein
VLPHTVSQIPGQLGQAFNDNLVPNLAQRKQSSESKQERTLASVEASDRNNKERKKPSADTGELSDDEKKRKRGA